MKENKGIYKRLGVTLKIFCTSILFLVLVASCDFGLSDFHDNSPPSTESLRINRLEQDIKGSIKSYYLVVYKAIENEGSYIEGEIVGSIKNTFNIDRNKVESIRYDEKGKLLSQINYSYNPGGKHIKTNTSDSLGIINKDIYTYDANQNIIEWSRTDSNGNQSLKTIYTFDNKGNNIEIYNSSVSLKWLTFLNEFDSKGNKIRENRYNSQGTNKQSYTDYKYDGIGNVIERSSYITGEGLSHSSSFKYNSKNDVIEEFDLFSRYGDAARTKHIYKYDDKDNLLERFRYSLSDRLQYSNAYEYEYDVQKNWVKKLEIINGVTEFIAKREIEYY